MEPRSSSDAAEEPPQSVTVLDPRWHRLVRDPVRIVRAALGGVSAQVVLADDRTLKALNARYRPHGPIGSNRPTNVLTFDATREIVLASGTVAREARAARRSPAHHLAHLVVHGALHLEGHLHDGPGEARRMEMAEARRLARFGVPNPWKPRA